MTSAQYEVYARLRALADSPAHIVPGHDPLVLQRYPAASKALEGIAARLDRRTPKRCIAASLTRVIRAPSIDRHGTKPETHPRGRNPMLTPLKTALAFATAAGCAAAAHAQQPAAPAV